MKAYGNLQGNSGVIAYETGKGYIKVCFSGFRIYTYTDASTGEKNIKKMHALAHAGKGLSTFISRYIKDKFEH